MERMKFTRWAPSAAVYRVHAVSVVFERSPGVEQQCSPSLSAHACGAGFAEQTTKHVTQSWLRGCMSVVPAFS